MMQIAFITIFLASFSGAAELQSKTVAKKVTAPDASKQRICGNAVEALSHFKNEWATEIDQAKNGPECEVIFKKAEIESQKMEIPRECESFIESDFPELENIDGRALKKQNAFQRITEAYRFVKIMFQSRCRNLNKNPIEEEN